MKTTESRWENFKLRNQNAGKLEAGVWILFTWSAILQVRIFYERLIGQLFAAFLQGGAMVLAMVSIVVWRFRNKQPDEDSIVLKIFQICGMISILIYVLFPIVYFSI